VKKIFKHCQALANLCALQLYSSGKDVCDLMNTLADLPNPVTPKLQLTSSRDKRGKSIIEDPFKIKFHASFSQAKSNPINVLTQLTFKLAKFNIEGDFLGFEDLADQLFLCDTPDEDLERLLTIGTTMKKSCVFDLTKLMDGKIQSANFFYEMFLLDYDQTMHQVPIKITNY